MFDKFKNQTKRMKVLIVVICVIMLSGVLNLIGDFASTGEPLEAKDHKMRETEVEKIEVEDLEKEKKEEDFIKEAKKKSDKKKAKDKAEKDKAEKEKEYTTKEWDAFKTKFLDHYGDAEVLDIQVNPGSDYETFNVYVPNEFKLSTEEEKTYYVEEIGAFMQQDLEAQFPDKSVIHIYFKYQDENVMAKAKMFGGWKVK